MKKENLFFRMMFYTGIVFAAYGALMLAVLGIGYFFNYFFFLWGIVLMLTSRYHKEIKEKLGNRTYRFLSVITYICLSIFMAFEIFIICFGFIGPKKDASIIIVLGSGVEKDMSLTPDFRGRLDACLDYYEDNKAIIVVTGKKGINEPIAEAIAAKDYLIANGVDEKMIRIDDQSKDTYENIRNAYDLTRDIKEQRVVIVSSYFHLFRGYYIAHMIGFDDVSCKGSAGHLLIFTQYYAREFAGFIKDFTLLSIRPLFNK